MAMAELFSESECINTNTTMCVDGIHYTCCGRMGYYCQTDLSSSPFWIGTLIYVILGVIGCAVGGLGFGRNNAKLGIYLACVATVCLWIPWACTWLSQWHPLIYPEYEYYVNVNSTLDTQPCNPMYDNVTEWVWLRNATHE
mmetsp:Transcript_19735/g.24335  ORF Transcript_19735/g.24335 Transcript_19735/m.24335 type:complete len:141 (-) Transcript_19735:164-586(-)